VVGRGPYRTAVQNHITTQDAAADFDYPEEGRGSDEVEDGLIGCRGGALKQSRVVVRDHIDSRVSGTVHGIADDRDIEGLTINLDILECLPTNEGDVCTRSRSNGEHDCPIVAASIRDRFGRDCNAVHMYTDASCIRRQSEAVSCLRRSRDDGCREGSLVEVVSANDSMA
jgi:hypothetical protein